MTRISFIQKILDFSFGFPAIPFLPSKKKKSVRKYFFIFRSLKEKSRIDRRMGKSSFLPFSFRKKIRYISLYSALFKTFLVPRNGSLVGAGTMRAFSRAFSVSNQRSFPLFGEVKNRSFEIFSGRRCSFSLFGVCLRGGGVEFCQVARAQTQTNRPHPRWTGYAHLTRPRLLPPTLLLLSWLAAFRSYLGTVFTRTFYTRCPGNRGKGEESKIRKEDLIALQLEIFIFRRMEFNRIFLILVSLYL